MGRRSALLPLALVALLAVSVVDYPLAEVSAKGPSAGIDVRQLQDLPDRERVRPALRANADGNVVVEVLHKLTAAQARKRVTSVGGTVTGEVPGTLVQAELPLDRVIDLERSDGVISVAPPRRATIVPVAPKAADDKTNRRRCRRRGQRRCRRGGGDPLPPLPPPTPVSVIGEEVAKTNAAAWHAAGRTGVGVKVGIIDVFSSTAYNAAARRNEVPTPAGTFCINAGVPCDIFTVTPDQTHGTAVAEVIHEQAPGAQLFLAFGETTADYNAIVNNFISLGVKIISRSLGSDLDGAGKGDGPMNQVVDRAVAGGIAWFEAAGNAAGPPGGGGYYRGTFTDADNDGVHEWAPGDEIMSAQCFSSSLGLRWDDFDETGVTDFDLVAVDRNGVPFSFAEANQGTGGAPPIENFASGIPCTDSQGVGPVGLAITLFSAGTNKTDVLEYTTNGEPVEFSSNPFSAAVPVCDSRSPGLVCVGAIDPALGIAIADYSSQGPTNDNRIKPDLSAAACVRSVSIPPCFNGTSSATPATSGAAALVLGAGLASNPADLASFMTRSTIDRGAPGKDNVFGQGELVLPAP